MTLTVRLSPPLDQALADFCSSHGLSKSQVVQQSLAEHLHRSASDNPGNPVLKAAGVSPAFAAFKRAGLIGTVRSGKVSATRDVVRARVGSRLNRGG